MDFCGRVQYAMTDSQPFHIQNPYWNTSQESSKGHTEPETGSHVTLRPYDRKKGNQIYDRTSVKA